MKQAMDLFGQALYDRLNGETEAFYMDFYGDIDEHNLERYFRTIEELSLLEKRMIAESYGDILDIGCGTAHYFPLLNKQGKVVGIDISEKVIEVAHKMGNENCVVGDIFSLDENKQFDTITMFENNIGIGETLEGTKTMLSKISNLLKNTGQLLIQLTGRIQDKEYAEVELTPIYKNQRGITFRRMNFNREFLLSFLQHQGFTTKLLSINQEYSSNPDSLIQAKKISS